MVKAHNVKLQIYNHSGRDMTYVRAELYSGRVADEFSWPKIIRNGETAIISCYERDYSAAGCSGYMTYSMSGTEVTIAFSNPVLVTNKLNAGEGGTVVWDNMNNEGYKEFVRNVTLADNTPLSFNCKCTGGTTNVCNVKIVN